ncbi:MAG: hypothetical protein U0229_17495 [Anaeromyxobacter sp.]
MTRLAAALFLALAAGGVGFAVRTTGRVDALEAELAEARREGSQAGASFVETLRGEHAERQRVLFERRRVLALDLAAARRDRLLAILGAAGAGLTAGALVLLRRIAAEIEEDRRHLQGS